MKGKSRKLNIIVLSITIFIVLAFFGGMLGSGGNGYAEQYEFQIDTAQLIKVIKDFKNNNKSFNPPPNLRLTDFRDSLTSDYNINLYFQNKNSIIYCYINTEGTKAIINLVSINQGFVSPVYKIINKDLDRKENLEVKKEFEGLFLEKLKLPYKDKGNNMFVFWK
jgi:hypothetical protein